MHPYIEAICKAFESFADRIAVVDQGGDRRTSYRELGELSLKTAAWLLQQELPDHSFVPICLPASAEYVAAEIGVWLAGYAAVPMGTSFPEERVK